MNVQELIQHLEKLDPNTRVIIRGYEGGFSDITNIADIPIKLNVNTAWYYGPHEEVYDEDADERAYLLYALRGELPKIPETWEQHK